MKILIVKTFPGEIDIKKITYNHQELGLARAFIEAGHQCDVMCCADQQPSVQTIPVEGDKTITLYCMKAIKILKNGFICGADHILEKYDILQVSEYNQLYTWHLAKKYKEKMICYHGPYYCAFNKRYNLMAKVFDRLFLRRYLKLNTWFITKSRLAEQYLRGKGIRNVRSVGVGIDRKALATSSSDRLGFADVIRKCENKKVMYIGKLEPRRNVFFLLDILKALNERLKTALVLVGSGEDQYVAAFFEKAEKMGLKDKIIYQESVEQRYMEQLYPAADVFLLPTIYDIYGMVLLEAMYFRQCVITTVNGGSDMMIKNQVNGFVMDGFDAAKWADAAFAMLCDSEKRAAIAQAAHDTVSKKFTWQALCPEFLSVYAAKAREETAI